MLLAAVLSGRLSHVPIIFNTLTPIETALEKRLLNVRAFFRSIDAETILTTKYVVKRQFSTILAAPAPGINKDRIVIRISITPNVDVVDQNPV